VPLELGVKGSLMQPTTRPTLGVQTRS
jgi:hypothetical protein